MYRPPPPPCMNGGALSEASAPIPLRGGPAMSDLVIEAKDLTKQYGDFVAIDKLNFEVKRGEIVGLLGPNGAGKSTTMKILTCYAAPSAGSAKVNGHDVFDEALKVREAIGYLPESTP